MKSFDEAWKELGYEYGEDALESVKLGWELALKTVIASTKVEYTKTITERSEKERLENIRKAYISAENYELNGRFDLAAIVRPCCPNEKRGMNGGCISCGDPCY